MGYFTCRMRSRQTPAHREMLIFLCLYVSTFSNNFMLRYYHFTTNCSRYEKHQILLKICIPSKALFRNKHPCSFLNLVYKDVQYSRFPPWMAVVLTEHFFNRAENTAGNFPSNRTGDTVNQNSAQPVCGALIFPFCSFFQP